MWGVGEVHCGVERVVLCVKYGWIFWMFNTERGEMLISKKGKVEDDIKVLYFIFDFKDRV